MDSIGRARLDVFNLDISVRKTRTDFSFGIATEQGQGQITSIKHKYPPYQTFDQVKRFKFFEFFVCPYRKMNSKILILGFHRVGYPPQNARIRGLFTTPRLLTFELWLLSKLGYQFSTLRDAMTASSDKLAVITFDDGYEDNFTEALPILERFRAPATIFVITGDVGKKAVVWDESDEKLPADMITWEMLAELQKKGWEIGSHGHSHVHFDTKNRPVQESLICHSMAEIEDGLGTVPISFAYPFGSFDETTKATLRRFGIRFAVTTDAPLPWDVQSPSDLLELKRVQIGGRKFYHFAKAVIRTLKAIGLAEAAMSLVSANLIRIVPQRTVGRRF